MNRRRITRRAQTAYHEAGHAVAAYLVRKKFRYVTIRSSGKYEGHLRHEENRNGGLPDPEEAAMTRSALEKDIMVSVAGYAALYLLTGRHDRIGAYIDRQRAMDLAENVCLSRKECEAYVKWLYARCIAMLRSQANWHAVETLAEELLSQETIGYKRATALIRAAKRQFRRRRWKDSISQVLLFPASGK